MNSPYALLQLLWEAWFVSWMLAAVWSRRTVERQPPLERLVHTAFWMSGALLLYVRWASLGPLLRPLYPHQIWIAWTGVVITFLGLAYTWWARLHLGSLWSGTVTLKSDHAIVRSGPYAITRHPIYTGLLVAIAATAVVRDAGTAVLGFGLLVIGIVLKLRQEERLLTAHFGDAYRDYKAAVPALLPGIW